MRVIVDTNVLVGALITKESPPDAIYQSWRDGRFTLVSCEQQLIELREVTRRIAVALRIKASEAGHLVNSIRGIALMIDNLPLVERASDPADDFLLALAQAGAADFLVTGDKKALLTLQTHGSTRIVTARAFWDVLNP